MRYVRGIAAVVLVAVAGCSDIGGPDIEAIDFSAYNLSLSQGGASGVYFLPPLMHSTYTGMFDPNRDPVVHICAGIPAEPCASPVAVFDMVLDPDESLSQVLRMSEVYSHYIVNWQTNGLPVDQYRIFVLEEGVAPAFIDVVVANGARRMRVYQETGSRPYSGTIPIKFRLEEVASEPQLPTTGLAAQYFDWRVTATDFNVAPMLAERLDSVIDFVDETGDSNAFGIGQSDHIMARWTGVVVAAESGFYTFCVRFDDGVRLFMNGFLFFESWIEQTATERCSSMFVGTAGQRIPITLEWFHASGGGTAQLFWESPNLAKQIVPTSALSPE